MKKILPLLTLSFLINIAEAQQKVEFTDSAFYPEGIAYNKMANVFYVGSVKTGTISKVDAAGKKTDVYVDASLKSSFGMKLDAAKNLLWVCSGDPNYSIYKSPDTDKKLARLIAIDVNTEKKLKDIDLSAMYTGNHFINDLTMDDAGNMFITDSYSPVIYKVDKAGKASLFVENGLFQGSDIGLNGIAWYPKGFLLTVNNDNGTILKVDAQTKAVTKVKIDQFFPGADGLLRMDDQSLILVQNGGIDKIFKITSTDNWMTAKVESATLMEDRFQGPSTATMKGNDIYVVNAKLDEITDSSKKPSTTFTLQQASLKKMN